MPKFSRVFRSLLGIPGVIALMLVILAVGLISAKRQKINDNVSLSVNFKTLRKLEYQEWLSRTNHDEYVDSDEVGADIVRSSGQESIFIKALPSEFTSGDGKLLSLRLNFADTVQAPMYLFTDSLKAQNLYKINEVLIGSRLAEIQSDWILVEVNGLSTGKYLRVTWPRITSPVIQKLGEYLQSNPEIKNFMSPDAGFSSLADFSVVGTMVDQKFKVSHVIYSELEDIYE